MINDESNTAATSDDEASEAEEIPDNFSQVSAEEEEYDMNHLFGDGEIDNKELDFDKEEKWSLDGLQALSGKQLAMIS